MQKLIWKRGRETWEVGTKITTNDRIIFLDPICTRMSGLPSPIGFMREISLHAGLCFSSWQTLVFFRENRSLLVATVEVMEPHFSLCFLWLIAVWILTGGYTCPFGVLKILPIYRTKSLWLEVGPLLCRVAYVLFENPWWSRPQMNLCS